MSLGLYHIDRAVLAPVFGGLIGGAIYKTIVTSSIPYGVSLSHEFTKWAIIGGALVLTGVNSYFELTDKTDSTVNKTIKTGLSALAVAGVSYLAITTEALNEDRKRPEIAASTSKTIQLSREEVANNSGDLLKAAYPEYVIQIEPVTP